MKKIPFRRVICLEVRMMMEEKKIEENNILWSTQGRLNFEMNQCKLYFRRCYNQSMTQKLIFSYTLKSSNEDIM